MKFTDTLGDQALYLRQLCEEDISPEYIEWLNDPEVNQFLEVKNSIPNLAEQKVYVNSILESGDKFMLGIFLPDDILVGSVTLRISDKKTVEIGIMIGNKSYQGRGVGSGVIKLITKWASESDFKALTAGFDIKNKASAQLFLRSGFKYLDKISESGINVGSKKIQRTILNLRSLGGQ